jgi:Fe-S-cluster containining protein
MSFEKKLALLNGIYRIYDEFIAAQAIACKRQCATCCTGNVTLTTLEGYGILSSLTADQESALLAAFRQPSTTRGFQPTLTTNQIAAMCLAEIEIPDESPNEAGSCPLLGNQECSIYSVRPFACRCMVSKHACEDTGYADMDEFVLTVNNLFLQYIEHIDRPGMTGSLSDVIRFLKSNRYRHVYFSGELSESLPPLIANRAIPALMIPPRHRERIQPILAALKDVLG